MVYKYNRLKFSNLFIFFFFLDILDRNGKKRSPTTFCCGRSCCCGGTEESAASAMERYCAPWPLGPQPPQFPELSLDGEHRALVQDTSSLFSPPDLPVGHGRLPCRNARLCSSDAMKEPGRSHSSSSSHFLWSLTRILNVKVENKTASGGSEPGHTLLEVLEPDWCTRLQAAGPKSRPTLRRRRFCIHL